MVQVKAISALDDNYIWAIINDAGTHAYVVDPDDEAPVQAFLNTHALTLSGILVTHHHWDHTNGISALKAAFPKALVYGPKNSPFKGIEHTLSEGDTVQVFDLTFSIAHTPGHTLDHICYINNAFIFSGDTLFSAGCGRLFEGTPAQMWQSMQVFKQLNDDTLVYCTHEYTQANVAFALAVEPDNQALQQYAQQVQQKRTQNACTLPTNIGLEKAINPFLRADSIAMSALPEQYQTQQSDHQSVFAAIRRYKDNF